MAKIFGVEFVKEDLEQAGKILNSRIGLAVLIWLVYNFGLAPKIDEIKHNSDKMAEALHETRMISTKNNELLVRLMERCDVQTSQRNGVTAQVKPVP